MKIFDDKNLREEDYVFFWGGIYSNWYPCNFVVDGIVYNCSEQYMMHQKALLFNDVDSAIKIMATNSPRDQKAIGRKIKNYDQKLWDEKKYELVKTGCRAKFQQNFKLKNQIIKDNGKYIVEASPEDNIWGIGFDDYNAIKNRDKWGENLLGKLLTELAKELASPMKRYEDFSTIKSVDWTKYKIVVPTEQDKSEIKKAFKHLHDADIDTDYVTVNQLVHEYTYDCDDNIVVSEELYNQLNKEQ